jgi:hypothetical protein
MHQQQNLDTGSIQQAPQQPQSNSLHNAIDLSFDVINAQIDQFDDLTLE